MARNQFPKDGEAEFPSAGDVRPFDDDASEERNGGRFGDPDFDAERFDAEPEEPSPFLRKPKRVPARRGPLPRKTASRLKRVLIAAAIVAVIAVAVGSVLTYAHKSWRFRIDSSDNIDVRGTDTVTRAQVMEVFGGDIARNIFAVPLATRKKQLEQIPWVESATLMRLLPNRLRVEIKERTPVAFVQIGSRIALIDANGVIMERPEGRKYSFAVITGMVESEPLSTRAPRMRVFAQLLRELDSDGGRYSQDLQEVELSDIDDVRVFAKDANAGVIVHLGSNNFLQRYKIFITNIAKWRQERGDVRSVDLRYDRQVILSTETGDSEDLSAQAPKPAATQAAPVAKAVQKPTPHLAKTKIAKRKK